MTPPRARRGRVLRLLRTYTTDLTRDDLRLLTRDTRDAYRFFSRGMDHQALAAMRWHRRLFAHPVQFLQAVARRLSPARRLVFGVAVLSAAVGLLQLFRGVGSVRVPLLGPISPIVVPTPEWVDGTLWLAFGFAGMGLLVLLEVADRLSLKNDLEVAREIQQAMLPQGVYLSPGVEAHGLTRPANTVGGDFYDILPRADGRVVLTLGDVSGKGSPASLLMALLLAVLHTLLDEGLDETELLSRLNVQIIRHAPRSRFITMVLASYEPATGRLIYVNAGHLPPLVRRRDGRVERLTAGGGIALGMFEGSGYEAGTAELSQGDLLVLYSDGITEAEDPHGRPFDDAGLQRVVEASRDLPPVGIGAAVFEAVARHARDTRFTDDLTILVLRRVGLEATPAAAAVTR